MLDSIIFYFFAGIAVLSALLMITRRNAIHSAVFLTTALLATAGIFLQLHAEFLFIVQIILYVGGIMVMFIFVIMLVRLDVALPRLRSRLRQWSAILVALAVFLEAGIILYLARRIPGEGLLVPSPAPAAKLPPNTEDLANSLFHAYLLPFEIASVLLLVAMIGAVVMGKNRSDTK
ncbi:MAG TPA: NADH-quinone oxidoreductase subunit J [Candidatus Eisenbacteria bacterium]|nr:NADH-quinone oxidoreductase subunit J [Candidatus Eisenbacteria bacterium]